MTCSTTIGNFNKPLEISIKNVKRSLGVVSRPTGAANSSWVVRCEWVTGAIVAAKMKLNWTDPKKMVECEEAEILAQLNGQTLFPAFFGINFFYPTGYVIVTSFCEGGSLDDYIQRVRGARISAMFGARCLSTMECLIIAKQLVDALSVLHEKNIAHFDIRVLFRFFLFFYFLFAFLFFEKSPKT